MILMKYSVLMLCLLTVVLAANAGPTEIKNFQPCSPANATEQANGCPKGSNCIENGTVNGTTQGFCVCESNFLVNQKFVANDTNSQYCVEKKSEIHPTETTVQTTKAPAVTTPSTVKPEEVKTTPKTTSATTTTTTTKKPEPEKPEDKNDVKVAPAPQGHHIIGGILLPIFIVLAFIGGVFAIRKYDLIERAHGYIRHRHQETRYNGLMENDFDDDPLLI